jgi:hypothetical protein
LWRWSIQRLRQVLLNSREKFDVEDVEDVEDDRAGWMLG